MSDTSAPLLIVETFDADGRLLERVVGLSATELRTLHERGECCPTCSHCHQELARQIGEDAALRQMYQRTFNKPAPWP